MRLVAALAALAVLVIGPVGCGAARTARAPGPEEPAVATSRKTPPQRPAGPAPASAAGPAAPPPENPWFPPADWNERRNAEDFRIGVLQGGGAAEEAAYGKLQEVCEGLLKGTVVVAALDPDRAAGLSELLSAQIDRGGRPAEYRIGRLERISESLLSARVRFSGERGSSEGEAFLVRLPDGWFVSDLQIELSMPRSRRQESFVPSPYRARTD